jgi:hypothetical protein
MQVRTEQFFCEGQNNCSRTCTDVHNSRPGQSFGERQHGLNHMLGLGAGDKDGRGDDEVHAPELLVSGDVLGGDALRALGKGIIVASYVLRAQILLGMSVQVGTFASENEHEENFGIHSGRADVSRG